LKKYLNYLCMSDSGTQLCLKLIRAMNECCIEAGTWINLVQPRRRLFL
jgi:hypothetical protein